MLFDVLRNFLSQLGPFREPPPKGSNKGIVAFASLRLGSRLFWFGQGRCRREPEANENRQGFDRDTDIPLRPGNPAINLIQPFGRRGLLSFRRVWR